MNLCLFRVGKRLTALIVLTALGAGAAVAQVTAKDAWVRTTVPQQKATGVFLRLTALTDSRLIEVSSPLAGVAEIHSMVMVGNTMQMRAMSGLDVTAGKALELKPGGFHIMLLDLKQQIKVGDVVPVKLVFEDRSKKRETIEVQAPARAGLGVPQADH